MGFRGVGFRVESLGFRGVGFRGVGFRVQGGLSKSCFLGYSELSEVLYIIWTPKLGSQF